MNEFDYIFLEKMVGEISPNIICFQAYFTIVIVK